MQQVTRGFLHVYPSDGGITCCCNHFVFSKIQQLGLSYLQMQWAAPSLQWSEIIVCFSPQRINNKREFFTGKEG